MPTTWKRDFASGLVVLTPLLVTVFVLAWIYNHIKQIPVNLEPAPLRVAVTLVVFITMVFAVGYLMRTAVGAILERMLDDLMNKLPGLRVIYNASKTAAETAFSEAESLQAPVSIETWPGMRMTAFKTGETTADGRDVLFLPTAPNVTTGFVVELEPDQYEVRDEAVEEALTRVLSAGFGDSEGQSQALVDHVHVTSDAAVDGEADDSSDHDDSGSADGDEASTRFDPGSETGESTVADSETGESTVADSETGESTGADSEAGKSTGADSEAGKSTAADRDRETSGE